MARNPELVMDRVSESRPDLVLESRGGSGLFLIFTENLTERDIMEVAA
jgi:hypothetical protein